MKTGSLTFAILCAALLLLSVIQYGTEDNPTTLASIVRPFWWLALAWLTANSINNYRKENQ